ncbi:hypothetical protein PCURB6_44520 [Paenibacillus curdlanolyticus]|nr:hypothetical protein PCURB6_44520 [Paenibacillus curdlanolyticus]
MNPYTSLRIFTVVVQSPDGVLYFPSNIYGNGIMDIIPKVMGSNGLFMYEIVCAPFATVNIEVTAALSTYSSNPYLFQVMPSYSPSA